MLLEGARRVSRPGYNDDEDDLALANSNPLARAAADEVLEADSPDLTVVGHAIPLPGASSDASTSTADASTTSVVSPPKVPEPAKTSQKKKGRREIPWNVQRLFAELQVLDAAFTSTSRLTASFGWKNNEAFVQHDVQELNRSAAHSRASSFSFPMSTHISPMQCSL